MYVYVRYMHDNTYVLIMHACIFLTEELIELQSKTGDLSLKPEFEVLGSLPYYCLILYSHVRTKHLDLMVLGLDQA